MADNDELPTVEAGSAEALANMLEEASRLIEMTTGYKARCIAAGLSDSSAEQMAVQFHGGLVATWFSTT